MANVFLRESPIYFAKKFLHDSEKEKKKPNTVK